MVRKSKNGLYGHHFVGLPRIVHYQSGHKMSKRCTSITKYDMFLYDGRCGHRSLIRDIEMIRSMDLPEGSSLYLLFLDQKNKKIRSNYAEY